MLFLRLWICVRILTLPTLLIVQSVVARGQTVEDGSDRAIGPDATQAVINFIRQDFESLDAKVTELRRSGDSHICGSINVKNRDGLYTGERGFIVDLVTQQFGRVPDGIELLDPRAADFDQKEAIREKYFRLCLDI